MHAGTGVRGDRLRFLACEHGEAPLVTTAKSSAMMRFRYRKRSRIEARFSRSPHATTARRPSAVAVVIVIAFLFSL